MRSPLQPPYNGTFRVIKQDAKHFIVDVNGHQSTISLDRLKPAYLDILPKETSQATTSKSQVTFHSSASCLPKVAKFIIFVTVVTGEGVL